MMQPALKRAVIAFVLVSIIIVSFAALLHQQKSFTFSATAEKYMTLVEERA